MMPPLFILDANATQVPTFITLGTVSTLLSSPCDGITPSTVCFHVSKSLYYMHSVVGGETAQMTAVRYGKNLPSLD